MRKERQCQRCVLVKMDCFIEKNISCENCVDCSDNIVAKLEKKFNCCLKSNNDTDKPHGSVSILHSNPHQITVRFYDDIKKLKPANKGGIKKLSKIPSESEIMIAI